jgi:GxxExxY protein
MTQAQPDISGQIIGAAIRVHEELGPGFLEDLYEAALGFELSAQGFAVERQVVVPVRYQQEVVGEHRIGLLVEGRVIVELKAVPTLEPLHFAVLRSYLKATNCELGLLLNFAATKLEIKRVSRDWHARNV